MNRRTATIALASLWAAPLAAQQLPTIIAEPPPHLAPAHEPRVLFDDAAPASSQLLTVDHERDEAWTQAKPLHRLRFALPADTPARTWLRLEWDVPWHRRTEADQWPGTFEGTLNGTWLGRALRWEGRYVLDLPAHLLRRDGRNELELSATESVALYGFRIRELADPLEATHLPAAAMAKRRLFPDYESPRAAFDPNVARGGVSVPVSNPEIDIEHLDIHMAFDSAGQTFNGLRGRIVYSARADANGIATFHLELTPVLTVESVRDADTAQDLVFSHGSNRVLTIALPRAYNAGETFRVEVSYSGVPPSTGFGSFSATRGPDNTPWIYTLSEPYGASDWWPCENLPDDKTTTTISLTVVDTVLALSNGTLDQQIDNGDGTRTFVWNHRYPMSSYLFSVIVGNFVILKDTYTALDGSTMPLEHWVFSNKVGNATFDYARTGPMLHAMALAFGEYPFVEEKYVHGTFGWGGGMEHQTASSIGNSLITGDRTYEWLYAHEAGHQWWGDMVTIRNFSHIWLNEGFASYSEAVWAESLGGSDALEQYMLQYFSYGFTGYPVLDPGEANLFGTNVYRKGMWILHMLRGIMGDEDFFATLKEYGERHKYGNAVTDDFIAVCEEFHGAPLDWFFDPWLTRTGKPTLRVGTSFYRTLEGDVFLTGTTSLSTGYRMPVRFKVDFPSGAVGTGTFWSDADGENFAINIGRFAEDPGGVTIDPDYWLLRNPGTALTVQLTAHVSTPLDDAIQNGTYRTGLYASGGTGPYTWEHLPAGGAMVPGLSLNGNVLEGTPTEEGTYPLRFRVTDGASTTRTVNTQLVVRAALSGHQWEVR